MSSPTPAQRWTAIVVSAAASLWWAMVADAAGRELFPDPKSELFFLVLFLFSLFGGLGRMLFLWRRNVPWQRQAGSLMLSVFGAWLVALYFWESTLPSAELLAAAGAMAAIGGEVVERLGRLIAGRVFGARGEDGEDDA